MPKSVTFDREVVMDRVTDLFWKKGYNGTSMQDLVDATGLNRSSFYNSFSDKFSLFEASLAHYQRKQYDLLDKFLGDGKSPKGTIIALFKGMTKDMQNGNPKGCMITGCTSEMGHDPKVKDFLVSNKERVVKLFTSLIKAAQELDEIDPKRDAHNLALFLFSSLHGLRITSLIESDTEGIIDEIIRVL